MFEDIKRAWISDWHIEKIAINSEHTQHCTIREKKWNIYYMAQLWIIFTVSILSKYSIELTKIYWDVGRRAVRELNPYLPITGNHEIICNTEKKNQEMKV